MNTFKLKEDAEGYYEDYYYLRYCLPGSKHHVVRYFRDRDSLLKFLSSISDKNAFIVVDYHFSRTLNVKKLLEEVKE